MNAITRISALMFLAHLAASGDPTGICLFAPSPESPPSEVQAFEYEKFEKTSDGVRCFQANGSAVVVTAYKLRGIIPYPKQILGADPKLPKQLEELKAYSTRYPRIQPFLKPFTDKIAGALSAKNNLRDESVSLPTLKIGNEVFLSPSLEKVSDGKITLRHRDGFTGFAIKDLRDSDIAAINKLADGSRKLCRPSLVGFDLGTNKYTRLTLADGTQYRGVSLKNYDNGQVVLATSSDDLKLTLADLAAVRGFSETDRRKVDEWVREFALAQTKLAEAEYGKPIPEPPKHAPEPEEPQESPSQPSMPAHRIPYGIPYGIPNPPVSSLQSVGGGG